MYTESNLVGIAKRENNNRRNYLVVNRLQGKHVPVKPRQAIRMFEALGSLIKERCQEERLLFIGFAETATAIGASVACQCGGCYIQTTREVISDVEYLFFSEAHSHATEQKLVKNDMDQVMDNIDRIVFIEDEVTTGNTIMNIITLLNETYQSSVAFSVASLLNGMDDHHQQIYEAKGIDRIWLARTNQEGYGAAAETVTGDGEYIVTGRAEFAEPEIRLFGYRNARRLVQGSAYLDACQRLFNDLQATLRLKPYNKILVLGTEEFMFPALYTAYELERQGKDVRFHATTRSPIAVSRDPVYPLHTRYELISLYDRDRTTYVYDLDRYDKVIIITDSEDPALAASLTDALHRCGNRDITYVRWRE